jgi:hypothetical protein
VATAAAAASVSRELLVTAAPLSVKTTSSPQLCVWSRWLYAALLSLPESLSACHRVHHNEAVMLHCYKQPDVTVTLPAVHQAAAVGQDVEIRPHMCNCRLLDSRSVRLKCSKTCQSRQPLPLLGAAAATAASNRIAICCAAEQCGALLLFFQGALCLSSVLGLQGSQHGMEQDKEHHGLAQGGPPRSA